MGRLEGCEIWGNANGGVEVSFDGDPTLAGCSVRDHVKGLYGRGCGVYVNSDARGKATIGSDCIFVRNADGDVEGQTRCGTGWGGGAGRGGVGSWGGALL